ncbi:thiosulfate ABC transporter substrate-binding protein CysP [Blochmannia endosymbiont of Camponotus (Colobopsis) obliquus]|uniref:thiosulfate ABC transporter substrate-binding protein CysP n=1 Tax=Blochmannia endosymbiont of Camponotus (Colobopsis) obliquus TaxID=1505597 RepID=UPI00061A7DB8|nr:thiosulfate ABC transporter substrate-binding protein CysP [Blochmannia endosymbiont of Camponotus (Colobopsis) obliquus]AKC60661.1 thiosulfate-binding protein [Blochmannia endosymbiont of Camponotus (Colobopsis) obliquus]
MRRVIIKYLMGLLFIYSNPEATILLNSSYDISRELFITLNPIFIDEWHQKHPDDKLSIRQSHAASTRQAMAILQGLRADVVTYNQVVDVQVLHDRGHLISADWRQRLPNNSSPYYSTMVFFVRKGNPKKIYDWYDLVRDDVKLIFPNPKISGSGRYTYLAAWSIVSQRNGGNLDNTRIFMSKFLKNVEVFDIGGRNATTTFLERGQGDVLISFESELYNILNQYGDVGYEVVVPEISILAEFPVTWVDKNIDKNGTREVAIAYLNYLYSTRAQEIIAKFYYRVNSVVIMKKNKNKFPSIRLFKVEDYFDDWQKIMNVHFSHGGELDKLLKFGRYYVFNY